MLHHMLRYPEMFTDLVFIAISTMPLELRIGGVFVDRETSPSDSHCITPLSTNTRRQIRYLPEWRKHTSNQITTYTDLKQSRVIIDKISQFSMRPPEFLNIIDMVGNYYRWFFIDMKDKVKGDDLEKNITINLNLSSWIDCLERKVKLREMALPELLEWCDYVEGEINENEIDLINSNGQHEMIDLFRDINNIIIKHKTGDTMDEDELGILCCASCWIRLENYVTGILFRVTYTQSKSLRTKEGTRSAPKNQNTKN